MNNLNARQVTFLLAVVIVITMMIAGSTAYHYGYKDGQSEGYRQGRLSQQAAGNWTSYTWRGEDEEPETTELDVVMALIEHLQSANFTIVSPDVSVNASLTFKSGWEPALKWDDSW